MLLTGPLVSEPKHTLSYPSPPSPKKKMSKYGNGVLLKGLPFSVKEEEVKAFFKSIMLPSSSIHIVRYPDGKGCGIGFVELKSKEEVDLALLMDRNHIGPRYVEVSAASLAELQLIKRSAAAGHTPNELYKLASQRPGRGDGGRANGRERSPVRNPKSRFVYLQGIPNDHNYKEVRKFFSGCVIGKNCVSLVRGPNGVFRGDGFVEFLTVEDAQKALERDGCLMNGHPIKVKPSSEEEALRILGGSWSPTHSPPSRRRRDDYVDPPYFEDREGSQARWDDRVAPSDRGGYDTYRSESRPYPLMESPPPPPVPLFPPSEPIRPLLSPSEDYSYGRSRATEPYQRITESRDGYRTPSFMAQRNAHASRSHPSNRLHPRDEVVEHPLRGRREAHAVVRLEGLPFSASVTDVVSFFQGFDVKYDDVRIQCREDGSPSGKAFVTFRSEWLAKSAIRELDRQYIMGRYVELYLV